MRPAIPENSGPGRFGLATDHIRLSAKSASLHASQAAEFSMTTPRPLMPQVVTNAHCADSLQKADLNFNVLYFLWWP
jgi:hypothetical protein